MTRKKINNKQANKQNGKNPNKIIEYDEKTKNNTGKTFTRFADRKHELLLRVSTYQEILPV